MKKSKLNKGKLIAFCLLILIFFLLFAFTRSKTDTNEEKLKHEINSIGIESSETPLTVDQISEYSRKNNLEIPKEYVTQLLLFNGGGPRKRQIVTFTENGEKTTSRMTWFACVDFDKFYPENIRMHEEFRKKRIKKNCFIFGRDGLGDMYVISKETSDLGKVYFWDIHSEKFWICADSYLEFLQKLTVDED
jgi:hypothetical protein